jgi:sugar O-acyltransferase (sialic acid O-acetyltransferase NeuD family)
MTRVLAILGAGGHAKVVADTALEIGWDPILFFDDRIPRGTSLGRWSVGGDKATLIRNAKDYAGIVVAIGDNGVRRTMCSLISVSGGLLVSLVHPRAYVSKDARIGAGTVVFAGAVVQSGAVIGDGVIVNTGATVDHDCFVNSFAHLCPGVNLAGSVSVGEGAWVGIGSCVRQQVSIGADAIIGAGAAVVSDVSASTVVVGVPARLFVRR